MLFVIALPVIFTALVRAEASIILVFESTVTGDLVLSVIVKSLLKSIFTELKFAAPVKIILPLSTVTMTLSPLFFVEYFVPAMESVDVESKPKIVSLPAPAL